MIPKIIHYCWFGKKPLTKTAVKCIESWKRVLPDYEIRVWNEDNFDVGCCDYVREAYDAKKWAFVSDYVRLHALVTYGGIYMDTDVEVVKSLDPYLKYEAFAGFQSENEVQTGLLACEKNCGFFRDLLSEYAGRHFLKEDGTYDVKFTNVDALNEACRKMGFVLNNTQQEIGGIALFPKDIFCGKDYLSREMCVTENTVTVHHFEGSWTDADAKMEVFILEKTAGRRTARLGWAATSPIRGMRRIKWKLEGKSTLAKNAFFSVLYRLLNILFPLISYGYVARILTSEGVGRHAAAANNVSYFVILGSLGIQAYATREIARRKGDAEGRARLFSEMLIVNAVLTAAAIVLFLICLLFLPLFREEKLLYLICAVAVATNFINVDWYFQGTEDFRFIAVRSFAVKAVFLAMVFLFVRTAGDLYKYALICVLANGGNHVLNILRAGKANRIFTRGTRLHPNNRLKIRPHIRPLVFLALCTVSTELYARLDITMLDIMDEKATVAYYSYAQKIIMLLVTTVIAITAVFLPRLSYCFEKDRPRFNHLTKFGTDLMIFLSIPMCLGLVSIAQPLISVWLGSGYEKATNCLLILSFMIPLKCIGDIVCYQVMMCAGRESYLMVSYMITLVVNFLCNLLLIPRYGALGASIASLISEIVVFGIVLFASKKYQEYSPDKRNLIVVLFSSLVMCGAVLLFGYLFRDRPWVGLLGGCVTGAVLFAILNIVLKNTFLTEGLLKRTCGQLKRGTW